MHERNSMCESIEKQAKIDGFNDIRCFIVTDKDGGKAYAICDSNNWIYASPTAEAVCVHLKMMKLLQEAE